jgi:hypothetical protein
VVYRVAQGNVDAWSEGDVIEEAEFFALFGEGSKEAGKSRLSELIGLGFLEKVQGEVSPRKSQKPATPPVLPPATLDNPNP